MEKGYIDFDNEIFFQILNLAQDGVYFVDMQRIITFWNKGAEIISGFTAQEVVNKSCKDNILNHTDAKGENLCIGLCPLAKTLEDGEFRQATVFLHHKDGQRVQVNIKIIPIRKDGKIIGAVEIFNDLAQPKKYAFEDGDLKSLAYIDQLTTLPNRRYAESYITNKINDYHNLGVTFWAVFVDIDNFKNINDTYGHIVGDKVLKAAAKTMSNVLGALDLASRWGGDEFLLILHGHTKKEVIELCETLRKIIETASIMHDDRRVELTVSIGAIEYNVNQTIEENIQSADKQLYISKRNGKNTVTVK